MFLYCFYVYAFCCFDDPSQRAGLGVRTGTGVQLKSILKSLAEQSLRSHREQGIET